MKKKLFFLLMIVLSSCQSTQVFIAERADKDAFEYGYGHFHFGPNPGDGENTK